VKISLPARLWIVAVVSLVGLLAAPVARAGDPSPAELLSHHEALKSFELTGGTAVAENLVLTRDRAQMIFNGQFYFEPPVAGGVRGAVFIGQGQFRMAVPPTSFEADSVRRMLKMEDEIVSDFRNAVFRFTDDTFEALGLSPAEGAAPSEATRLAGDFNDRVLRETGANLASRLLVSLALGEHPGLFWAQFDRGRLGKFTLLFDHQSRIPVQNFSINAGEKGLLFQHRGAVGGNDVWTAFFTEADYRAGRTPFADLYDLVDVKLYEMKVDVTDPGRWLRARVRMHIESLYDGIQVVPFALSEGLTDAESIRQKRGMKLLAARLAQGGRLGAIQEDWEGGVTLVFPRPLRQREVAVVELEIAGQFMFQSSVIPNCYFLLSNTQWYPRHGYLRRSHFDLTFRHRRHDQVASVGVRLAEREDTDERNVLMTRFRMNQPISFASFVMGRFERHTERVPLQSGGREVDVEFYSLPGSALAIKEDFVVAELQNTLNFFSVLFGEYYYPSFRAAFHPRPFGQGFPSMLLIPRTDRASKYTYSFVAHETAHQWWGNKVAWRSYRDQWLSEGFAEYSGILYTNLRQNPKAGRELLRENRDVLRYPPRTETGIAKGRLVDVGPLILGHRLQTRETLGAYYALTYFKGSLVLRMLHFLFTDPATGNGQPFFDMMSDFVARHRDGAATTESFQLVANEHFARTPIARRYNLRDLNWFFQQWVYEAHYPSYRAEYRIENHPEGGVVVNGTIFQENAPDHWFMPLPLVFTIGRDQVARGTIMALGPSTPFQIRLPQRPTKVELDPDEWVLAERTSIRGR
jgi:hypothetical protein